jgi:hypothetical protein
MIQIQHNKTIEHLNNLTLYIVSYAFLGNIAIKILYRDITALYTGIIINGYKTRQIKRIIFFIRDKSVFIK